MSQRQMAQLFIIFQKARLQKSPYWYGFAAAVEAVIWPLKRAEWQDGQ